MLRDQTHSSTKSQQLIPNYNSSNLVSVLSFYLSLTRYLLSLVRKSLKYIWGHPHEITSTSITKPTDKKNKIKELI